MSAVLRHVLLLQRDVPAAAEAPRRARVGRQRLHRAVGRARERGFGDGRDACRFGFRAVGPETVIALKHVDSEAHRATGYSPILSFTVSDLDQTVNNLLRAGASLDGPILYPPRGKVAALRAPDGHMLGLFEPAEGTAAEAQV